MASQTRYDLTKPLDQHLLRDASSLVADQLTSTLTAAPDAFPDGDDTAMCDASGGAFNVPLPLGTDDNIGLIFNVYKTDSSSNAAGLVCSGSQTFAPGGGTSLTTTVQGGKVSAFWDGTNWRNANPGSGSGGGSLTIGSSLTIGDGTGSTTVTQSKSNAGTAAYRLAVGATIRGDLALDASENVLLQQRDGSGVVVGALSFNNATGAASFSKALTIASGGLTVSAGGLTISAGGLTVTGTIKPGLPNYADNAAALAGGLVAGDMYRVGADVKVVV